jgi:hypothetical protein
MVYFINIPYIFNNYNIKLLYSLNEFNNKNLIEEIKNSNYLIINNIKNYENLKPETLKSKVNQDCNVIIIEYIRFNGFYPLNSIYSSINSLDIYDDSYINSNNYEDFINYKIDDSQIINNFNKSLEKLKILDENSDIKFYNFFVLNYKNNCLFRDTNHLSHIFIKHIVINLLIKMKIYIDIDYINNLNLSYQYGHKFRYRIILNSVKNALGLVFEDDCNINFYNNYFTKQAFYKTIKTYFNDPEIENKFNLLIEKTNVL